MKYYFIYLILFLGFASGLIAADNEEAALEKAFVGYMNDAIGKNGKGVASFFNSESLQWFSSVIQKARTAKEKEILALPLYEAQSILIVRLRLTPEQRREWNGKRFTEESYTKGWNSSQALVKLRGAFPECEKIWKVDRRTATLSMVYQSQPVKGDFRFIKETSGWKIDGLHQFKQNEEAFKFALQKSGLSKKQLIEAVISGMAGGRFPTRLWFPDDSG